MAEGEAQYCLGHSCDVSKDGRLAGVRAMLLLLLTFVQAAQGVCAISLVPSLCLEGVAAIVSCAVDVE